MTLSPGQVLVVAATAIASAPASAGLAQEVQVRIDPAVVIPDFNAEGVTIDVAANAPPTFVITSIVVGLVVEHEWQGDVSVFMENTTTGAGGFLLNRPGTTMWGGSSQLGYGAANFGDPVTNTPIVFDDGAAESINLYAGRMSGPGTGIDDLLGAYQPTAPLSVHHGGPGGIWRFTFVDHALGHTGAVHHMSLLIHYEMVPAPGGLAAVTGLWLFRPRQRRVP